MGCFYHVGLLKKFVFPLLHNFQHNYYDGACMTVTVIIIVHECIDRVTVGGNRSQPGHDLRKSVLVQTVCACAYKISYIILIVLPSLLHAI